jgi:hypothetical protein
MGVPGLVNSDERIEDIAQRYLNVAAGKLGVEGSSSR